MKPNPENEVQHIRWLFEARISQLESKAKQPQRKGVRLKKKERVTKIANEYLKLGEFRTYCEQMIKINEWEKALAFAPEVSYNYWQKLLQRRIKHFEEE